MGKVIWFINDYAGSQYHGMEFRNYYFAKEFIKKGYKVYIITASYSHLFKRLPDVKESFKLEEIDGINYLWVKVPNYGNSTSKLRALKWIYFTLKLLFLPFKRLERPDYIIASPMAPFLAMVAYFLAKRFGAKFIYEVKDIWPLSIVELGGFSPKHLFIMAMSWAEKFAIKRADLIVSSLQNYNKHLKENLAIDKSFLWVNNGISIDSQRDSKPLPDEVKKMVPTGKFIVGYTGAIGRANSLESLLESAKLLEKDFKDIHFIIVGDGELKSELITRFGNLENVTFIDPIEKSQVQNILKLFDSCYIGLKRERLFKYGVSPNKLFDYMYSSKPVIYAIDSGESNIVKISNSGVTAEPENPQSIKDAILKLYSMEESKRREMGERGREYVLNNFTYPKLADKFLKSLESLK
jgi:glycosyltransferase involved in cell wall biosynthesis